MQKKEKPITKKEACEVLSISYNTTRLNKIIAEFEERQEYVAKRKATNITTTAQSHPTIEATASAATTILSQKSST